MRRFFPTLALALFFFSAAAYGQDEFYFAQIGDGRAGDIQFQTSFILVNTGGNTNATLEFFNSAGAPLRLGLGQLGSNSLFQIALARGASISLQTPGTAGLQVGYARLTVPAGADVGGTAVFTRTHIPTGTILYEAGVPASRSLRTFSLFVDTIGNRDTGLAIVNVDDSPSANNMVNLRLYNTQFNQIATTNVPLAGRRHLPRFIPQIFSAVPQAAEMQGSVVVNSPDDLAAATLRTNDAPALEFPNEVPTLTAFPVVEGGASPSSVSGMFSLLSSGKVVVTLNVGSESPRAIGAIYSLFEGESLGRRLVRGIEDSGIVSMVLPAESADGTLLNVDRIEVELILEGGGKGPRFQLLH